MLVCSACLRRSDELFSSLMADLLRDWRGFCLNIRAPIDGKCSLGQTRSLKEKTRALRLQTQPFQPFCPRLLTSINTSLEPDLCTISHLGGGWKWSLIRNLINLCITVFITLNINMPAECMCSYESQTIVFINKYQSLDTDLVWGWDAAASCIMKSIAAIFRKTLTTKKLHTHAYTHTKSALVKNVVVRMELIFFLIWVLRFRRVQRVKTHLKKFWKMILKWIVYFISCNLIKAKAGEDGQKNLRLDFCVQLIASSVVS